MQHFQLIVQAHLVIQDGVVVKDRKGPVGREAETEDFKKADLIIKNGAVIRRNQ